MVKKPISRIGKRKSSTKHHGVPREELVTVKSDLILLAPELEDLDDRQLEVGRGRREDQGDPEDQQKGSTEAKSRSSVAFRVAKVCGKLLLLLGLLYLFVCSLNLLASSFRLLGGRTASVVFRQSTLLSNPVVGLMIGVLVTVLVQSSSTSSSIIVSMVAADFLDVPTAVPIIMGANIGTSITNTLVSIGQVGDREQFERAFSGAVIHDMFNWLCVLVLLPLEVTTGYLYHLTRVILSQMTLEHNNMKVEILSRITKPFTNRIVQLDKKVLTGWTMNDPAYENATLLRRVCPQTSSGNTSELVTCSNLAAHLPFPDNGVGVFLLIASLLMLCVCLILIVKILGSLLKGKVAVAVKHVINADIPRVPWLTGYLAILAGAVMTFILQSSSIFTSTLTPLVGLGVITVERVYPLTLGSNLGTTTTALLAALASDSSSLRAAIQIALVHLFFNVSGLLLWYPIPFLRFPVPMAKSLGAVTAKYRWFAIVYMALTFGILPLFVFLVSLGGPVAMYSVFVPLGIVVLIIVFINVAQNHFPKVLPTRLRTWSWLPLPLRSLQPYDDVITRLMCCVRLRPSYRYATVPPATAAAQNAPDTLDVLSVIEPSKNPVKVCDLGDGLVAEVVQVHDSDAPATLVIHHETSA